MTPVLNFDRPEILAPAGSYESLTAAVRCGADAVYLGGDAFNARNNADNFDDDTLMTAVDYCHSRDVKVYFALNTLIRENEMDSALLMAKRACEIGVDALILQDAGLARRIRACAPDAVMHASTQMSCHSPAGVLALRECGFSRVVLSREMSEAEIVQCTGLGVGLEVFVHGALCMCVSGQCLMSAVLGGRSGNRGLCAQPCRLPFTAKNQVPADGDAVLSLRDLSLVEHVGRLSKLGIESLKIEGRMKRPEYVAAAVTCYAAAVRGQQPSPQNIEDLQAVFSRSGFTDGYFTGRREDMFGTRRMEDVTAAAPVLSRLRQSYASQPQCVAVEMVFRMKAGAPVALAVRDGNGCAVAVTGELPQTAVSVETGAERICSQMKKTGGTPFYVTDIECDIDSGLSVPLSAVNALRREALELLLKKRGGSSNVDFDLSAVLEQPVVHASKSLRRGERSRLVVRVPHGDMLPNNAEYDMAVVPLVTPEKALRELCAKVAIAVEIPRALFGAEQRIADLLEIAAHAGATAALCNNVAAPPLAKAAGLKVLAGFGMGITNSDSLLHWAGQGTSAAVLSSELSFPQMNFAGGRGVPWGVFAYGRLPLMLVRCCPIKSRNGSCNGCNGTGMLTDRMGVRFPVTCGGTRLSAEVLNSVPVYLADRMNEMPKTDFLYLHFTDEQPADVSRIIWEYRYGGRAPEQFTRGMTKKGVI